MTGDAHDRPGEPVAPGARRPLELAEARRAAIDALTAYRAARDPAGLAAVFQSLTDETPAHWLLTGLLSVSSQLVEYLAASEKLEPGDVLRALASLDLEDELETALEAEEAALVHDDALVDEQGRESFPASDAPASWAGPADPPPA